MPVTDPADAPQFFPPIGAASAHSFFVQLLQHTPTPIYVVSPDGRYLFVNRAWEAFGGVPAGRVLGRPVGELYSPETARRLREANRRVLTSGAPLTLEEAVETATGVRHFQTVKFPVRDAVGAVVAVGGVSIDITERKRAENAALAADARSRDLLDESPDGIAVFRGSQMAYVNRAFCKLLGYDRPEELVGRCGADLLTDACKGRVVQTGLNRARGLPVPSCYEMECLHRDGRVVPVEVHVRLIDFDGAPSSLSHVRDITERKKSDEALRESEARLRGFFEAAFEAIVLHEGGAILDANQAAADLYRCAVGDLVGRNVLDFAAPASRETVRGRVADGDERPYEAVGLRPDGTTFPGELRAKNCVFQGRTVRVAALHDLTERKRTEETLRAYAGRLQALSRRLQDVQEQERRRLARELHDEVGQILTGLDLTLKNGGRLGDVGLRAAVGEAREMLRDLTARVRDLSLRLRPSMLDDLGLAPALEWHLRRFTAQTGVRVAFRHTGLGRRFSPEGETAAYRIVQEALTNVARHSGAAEAEVRISLDGGRLRLEIEDGGAGFDAGAAPEADACCGLSGMRQRAALRGGRFDLTSAPGAGTRLTAEWPEDSAGGNDGADAAGR